MPKRVRPQLVTIEGTRFKNASFMGEDPTRVAKILGIDPNDAAILTGNDSLTRDEINYLDSQYPEYMGIWPLLAKIGKAVVGAGITVASGIASRVKRKRIEKKAKEAQKKSLGVPRDIEQRQQAVNVIENAKKARDALYTLKLREKEQTQKKAIQAATMMIAIPAIAIIFGRIFR